MKFAFDREEINWSPDQTPEATGKINGKHWRAYFVGGKWILRRYSEDGLLRTDVKYIVTQLNLNTPGHIERMKARKTKIRRITAYTGAAALFLGTISSIIAIIWRKRRKL